jgi:hypothetical protein
MRREELEAKVRLLGARTSKKYALDHMGGGYRVESWDQSRYISPRLRGTLLALWLDGALAGVNEVHK